MSEGWWHCSMKRWQRSRGWQWRKIDGVNEETARTTSNGATTAAHDHDGWFAALSNNKEEVAIKRKRRQWEDEVDGRRFLEGGGWETKAAANREHDIGTASPMERRRCGRVDNNPQVVHLKRERESQRLKGVCEFQRNSASWLQSLNESNRFWGRRELQVVHGQQCHRKSFLTASNFHQCESCPLHKPAYRSTGRNSAKHAGFHGSSKGLSGRAARSSEAPLDRVLLQTSWSSPLQAIYQSQQADQQYKSTLAFMASLSEPGNIDGRDINRTANRGPKIYAVKL